MKLMGRLTLGALVGVLLLAIAVFWTTRNPLTKLDVAKVDVIRFTPPGIRLPTTGPPVSIALPPSKHVQIINALTQTQVEWNPAKWVGAGEMVISSSDGTETEVDFFDTGTDRGAFKIGDVYYRFEGNVRSLTAFRPTVR